MLLKLTYQWFFSESNHLETLPKNRNKFYFISRNEFLYDLMNICSCLIVCIFSLIKCIQDINLNQFFFFHIWELLNLPKLYSWFPLRGILVLWEITFKNVKLNAVKFLWPPCADINISTKSIHSLCIYWAPAVCMALF